jgi:hypothetical protein
MHMDIFWPVGKSRNNADSFKGHLIWQRWLCVSAIGLVRHPLPIPQRAYSLWASFHIFPRKNEKLREGTWKIKSHERQKKDGNFPAPILAINQHYFFDLRISVRRIKTKSVMKGCLLKHHHTTKTIRKVTISNIEIITYITYGWQ